MAVDYYLYQNNSENFKHKGMWYARVRPSGVVTSKELAEMIQEIASVRKSDVLAVLAELPDAMNRALAAGYRVKLDDFGSFKIGITSAPAKSPADFSVTKHIKGSRIIFQPEKTKKTETGQSVRIIAPNLEFKEVNQYTLKQQQKKQSSSGK